MTRVLGIDPGLASCGWAILRTSNSRPLCEASGAWKTAVSPDTAARIRELGALFANMLHGIDLVCAEGWQFQGADRTNHANASTIPRIIERLRVLAEFRKVAFVEVNPSTVKAALGVRDKAGVRRAVSIMVEHERRAPNTHATDAIAAAMAGERRWRNEAWAKSPVGGGIE